MNEGHNNRGGWKLIQKLKKTKQKSKQVFFSTGQRELKRDNFSLRKYGKMSLVNN